MWLYLPQISNVKHKTFRGFEFPQTGFYLSKLKKKNKCYEDRTNINFVEQT